MLAHNGFSELHLASDDLCLYIMGNWLGVNYANQIMSCIHPQISAECSFHAAIFNLARSTLKQSAVLYCDCTALRCRHLNGLVKNANSVLD